MKEDISPAYRIRRYGWNAKLPLNVLSDFEEFAVYDCRLSRKRRDRFHPPASCFSGSASMIPVGASWRTFSRDATILKGEFDNSPKTKAKRGTAEWTPTFWTRSRIGG